MSDTDTKLSAAALVGAAIVLAGGLVFAAGRLPAPGVAGGSGEPAHTISVVGTATSHLAPDQATFSTTVSSTKPTAVAARGDAATLATKVLDALHGLGIKEADITSTDISLSPVYPTCPPNVYLPVPAPTPPDGASGGSTGTGGALVLPVRGCDQPQKPIAWTMTQTLRVTIRDLTVVGPAIDAAIGAGASMTGGIAFGLVDPDTAVRAAQAAAVDTARTQSDALAAKAGVKVIGVASIDAGSSPWYPGPLYGANFSAKDAGSVATPVSPGTLDITGSVTVRFLIQ